MKKKPAELCERGMGNRTGKEKQRNGAISLQDDPIAHESKGIKGGGRECTKRSGELGGVVGGETEWSAAC